MTWILCDGLCAWFWGPIVVCGCGFLFGCAAVGRASDSVAALV